MVSVYGLRLCCGDVRYIGQTSKKLADRLSAHRYWAFKRQSQLPVHAWMRKYGADQIEIVELVSDATLNEDEIIQISLARQRGAKLLNCTDGGLGANGWKATEQTRRNISLGRRGVRNSQAAIDKAGLTRRALGIEQVNIAKQLRADGLSYDRIACQLGVSCSTAQSAIKMTRACYRVCTSSPALDTQAKLKEPTQLAPSQHQQKETAMADLDEKTQRVVDKHVKAAKRETVKAITDAVKGLDDDAKASDDKAVKTAVVAHHKAVKAAIKEAVAD